MWFGMCTSSERLSGIYTKIMSDGVGSCVDYWIIWLKVGVYMGGGDLNEKMIKVHI